jgi:hypothetical protein
MSTIKKCTACCAPVTKEIVHPLLYVPICENCHFRYNEGEFTVEDGNEIYCRFCGEGEGQLLLCDTCPKSFCARCVENCCGKSELRRIEKLSDRWHCFVCSPQPIQDLCTKNGWKFYGTKDADVKKESRKGLVYADISRGREKFEIPVINQVDNAPPPLNFVYVTEPVAGEGVILSNNPSLLTCCSCTDNCRDPTKCECAQRMGGSFAYDSSGIIMNDKPNGIYECNSRCSCHAARCRNRVVGKGPNVRLEVFRCDNPLKGWGVRCRDDIYMGTYVADYLGEILLEEDAEQRGLVYNDEYLFTCDSWGRMCAANRVADLCMKPHISKIKREVDMDITVMSKADISKYLDADLVDLLEKKGAISRAQEMGKQLREDPVAFLKRQEAQFMNEHGAEGGTEGPKRRISTKPQPAGKRLKSLLDLDSADISKAISEDSPDQKRRGKGEKSSSTGGTREQLPAYKSWLELHQIARQRALDQAVSIVTDRTVMEVEEKTTTYAVDGRYYCLKNPHEACLVDVHLDLSCSHRLFGSVARFLNNNCTPNLEKVTVYVESRYEGFPR